MNKNIQGDFQICISVPLKICHFFVYFVYINFAHIVMNNTNSCAVNSWEGLFAVLSVILYLFYKFLEHLKRCSFITAMFFKNWREKKVRKDCFRNSTNSTWKGVTSYCSGCKISPVIPREKLLKKVPE